MSKKIIGAVATMFIAILITLGTLLVTSSKAEETKNNEAGTVVNNSRNSGYIGTLLKGEKDPESYPYYTHTGTFEATQYQTPPHAIPIYGSYQIYCIEMGGQIRYEGSISYEEALAMVGQSNYSSYGCASTPADGAKTWPVYSEVGTSKLSPAIAYIVSGATIGSYTLDKQLGIWNTAASGLDEGLMMNTGSDGASSFDKEAADYADYDSKVNGKGLQIEDNSKHTGDVNKDPEVVHVLVDRDKKQYTVGPYKVNYVNGIYGDVAFSGISEMVVYGFNKNGKLVKNNIEVEKIILQDETTGKYGKAEKPEYFEPEKDSKVDRSEQKYPKPNQQFFVVFSDPNQGLEEDDPNYVTNTTVKVKFQYMVANGQYTKLKGTLYEVRYQHSHTQRTEQVQTGVDEEGNPIYTTRSYYSCTATAYLQETPQQYVAAMDAIRSIYEQFIVLGYEPGKEPPGDGDDDDGDDDDDDDGGNRQHAEIIMELGGYVWEDKVVSKESKADGVINTTGQDTDIRLKNVKVTLYDAETNKPAKLAVDTSEGDIMHRINSTYTDEDGRYLFQGVNSMKKYYVVFEYNGQRYLPTEYLNTSKGQYGSAEEMYNAGLFNTTEWKVTSKGTESTSSKVAGVEISRNDYDRRYQEIASYPENYPSSNNLGWASNGRNAAYTQLELMGYRLDDNGKYHQTETQLIDGYKFDENGLETTEFAEGAISNKVRAYIQSNKKFPDDNAMKQIYSSIAGSNKELQRKLQFIEDCYIQAYSGSPKSQKIDLYPLFDQFKINKVENGESLDFDPNSSIEGYFDVREEIIDGTEYTALYYGEYYVNLGLWRRQEFDAALRKDVYKATMKINGKTVVYNYDKRAVEDEGANNANGKDNNTYWDINVRMSDYDAYYNSGYNREVYQTDYEYNTTGGIGEGHPGEPLEMYITYKITVRNQSMSIIGQIKEVVDYYDRDYTYKPNLSWVIYKTDENKRTTIDKDKFYEMMEQSQDIIDNESTSATDFIENSKDAKVEVDKSRYGNEKDLGEQYQRLYVKGLEDKKLATGESAYIYLTFEVKKDESGRIILDDESSPKENIAEINGYSTYYRDGTELPNGVTKNSKNIAGLLDRDSNPGNLVAEDLQGEKYEKNFEDDTDRAPSLRVLVDEEAVRKANGTVWEDERTEEAGEAKIGDGIRDEDEIGIAGVTVQLIEKCTDGSEYEWQTTTTGEDGKYSFENYIPGDYVIRFKYGDSVSTALTKEDGGSNDVSYNGQDFKSTTYQKDIDQEGTTDISERYQGYINTEKQNESGKYNPDKGEPKDDTYGYDIYKLDSDETNYSDAKDIWSQREKVINYSKDNVTNHVAEVLASPYVKPTYKGAEYSESEMDALYQELMQNTAMTAETGIIVVEFEYDRQQADGLKETENNKDNSSKDYVDESNRYNSNYELNDIDLGLTERPKAQLEIDKSVTNVKVTLANNTILFDINKAANNALWQDHKEYNIGEEMKDGMYETYYGEEGKHRYSFRDKIDEIVKGTEKGLIQLTMDQELMHGATIQVTYGLKVKNVGEVDYVDGAEKDYYYKGVADNATISTTNANQVIDYVVNNLQFDSNNEANGGWSVIDKGTITSDGLVNEKLSADLEKFNNIIQTGNLSGDLAPNDEKTATLILSQLITPENTEDDLTYSNMVEIVKTSNTVGRRMAYSVVGNQDPTESNASEVDSSAAERIIILPPFGEVRIYYIIGAVIAVLLIGGIVLIRRKVLKGKDNGKNDNKTE